MIWLRLLALALLAGWIPFWPLGVVALGFPWLWWGAWIWLGPRSTRRWALLLLLLGLPKMTAYLNWGFSSRGSLRVMSANCRYFGAPQSSQVSENIGRFGALLESHQADILCTQDFSTDSTKHNLQAQEAVKKILPHELFRVASMASYSRWPIQNYQVESFPDSPNSYCTMDTEWRGQMVRVYNLHLQSYQFDRSQGFANLARLRKGLQMRATQAERVAESLRRSPYPVIVCGDFNDVPASYAYAQLAKGLEDGFSSRGEGWSRSYRGLASLRSDYILCSRPLRFRRYQEVMGGDFCDHRWVVAELDWVD